VGSLRADSQVRRRRPNRSSRIVAAGRRVGRFLLSTLPSLQRQIRRDVSRGPSRARRRKDLLESKGLRVCQAEVDQAGVAMTQAESEYMRAVWELFSRPLTFGDQAQIDALWFLDSRWYGLSRDERHAAVQLAIDRMERERYCPLDLLPGLQSSAGRVE
jgi:hypothetical protein